ncbi:MAG TPA: hypothetical protein VL693_11695 [Vicinamibacterales bacterium]|jgi:hypothetical protein|nr:hypothetical protein [Vicinamibacterales bacterium]
MRVRITKALAGSIDGIQLSRLSKGRVYDVNTSLACYLLSEEMAELFEAPSETRNLESFVPRSIAADRSRKKRNGPKKKEE